MHNYINLDRFPLDQLASASGLQLVERCCGELEQSGLTSLSGFLLPAALNQIVDDVLLVSDDAAFLHEREHNIYFEDRVLGLPPDDPALKRLSTSSRTVCADQIAGTLLSRIYEWPPLTQFLSHVMGKDTLYVMADPLARLNVMSYSEGQELGWHFDRSEFTTSLLLQSATAGGLLEYRQGLRSAEDPNYEGVANLLAGKDPDVNELRLAPGTLNIFRGRNTAHRVTPSVGPIHRLIAVFSYFDQPGVTMSDHERLGFYGRTK